MIGLSPKDPNKYVGPNVALNTVVTRKRSPTGADYRQPETGKLYPFNTFWLVGKDPTTGVVGDLWYLSKIVANVAYWVQIGFGAGSSLNITVPLGVSPIIPDGTATINFTSTGGTLAITGSSAIPNNHTINFDLAGILPVSGGGTGVNDITGILTGNGTSPITGSIVAQHGVLVAGVSNAVVATGVGLTGQILQGNTANDPTYSTATYPSTTTINQILYSSANNVVSGLATSNNGVLITSSAGVPSILASGTTGQVLTATTGSPPTWQDIGTAIFSPNAIMEVVDDFVGAVTGAVVDSNFYWSTQAGQIPAITTDVIHRGLLASTNISSGSVGLQLLNSQILLGGGVLTVNWVIKLGALSGAGNTYVERIGIGDTVGTDQINGIYFEYTDTVNSGNWQIKTSLASIRTTVNTSVAATITGFHNFGIVINANATSVEFFIDGVSQGTIITNIPTASSVLPFQDAVRTAGTLAVGTFITDLFYMRQVLTTPR